MFGEEDLVKIHRDRAIQVVYLVLMAFGLILLRLWYLQIFKGEQLHRYSVQNKLREEIAQAPRGFMYSRDQKLLVDNIPRFDVILTPQFLLDKKNTIEKLAPMINMTVEEIESVLAKKRGQPKYIPIIVKKNINFEEVAKIETENFYLPGVAVNLFISREYLHADEGAHLLGYISEVNQNQLPKLQQRDGIDYRLGDFIGQFGIEEQMDKLLRGKNGLEYVEVDAFGRKNKYINTDNLFKGIEELKPVPGLNLTLTVDSDLQNVAYNALEGKVGSLVALDVNTGEVLAMISRPSFDPSQFSRGITTEYWRDLVTNKDRPLRNRAIQEHYSPGSTFKPFTAIAALEESIIDENTRIRCHGTFRYGNRLYHSWKKSGSGNVNVEEALMESCNIFFYKIGAEIDIDVLSKYSKMFGLGEKTGINLPREISGLIPNREWKMKVKGADWQQGETLSCGIGQSYTLSTILQLASAYAAIANKGKLWRPYVVKDVRDSNGKILKNYAPELVRQIKLKEKTWTSVRNGLYRVVNTPGGTAFFRRGIGNQMAGKTGTSQVVGSAGGDKIYNKCDTLDYQYRHHGLFVGFAPFQNPKIAVAAIVEHGCSGSGSAAPVVELVVSKYLEKYFPEVKAANSEIEKKEVNYWSKTLKSANEAHRIQREQEEEDESIEEASTASSILKNPGNHL